MGTHAHLVVTGCEPTRCHAIDYARSRIDDLERRWSRFLPDSEISWLNASAGRGPCALSAVTFELVELAVAEWRRSRGIFDPTVLAALVAAGYDRSFVDLARNAVATIQSHRTPGCEAIVVDRAAMAVELPPGTLLDLGGIGKGRAVDIVADELREIVVGGCVNLGGDLRVWGAAPDDAGVWTSAIESDPSRMLMLRDGAVATSTITKRTWRSSDGRQLHHLIDPRTGGPSTSDLASVTVVAQSAAAAEVEAKVVLIAGDASATSLPALLVDRTGTVRTINGFDRWCW